MTSSKRTERRGFALTALFALTVGCQSGGSTRITHYDLSSASTAMTRSLSASPFLVDRTALSTPMVVVVDKVQNLSSDLIPPFEGSIKVNAEKDPTRRPIGMVFQAPLLMPWRTVTGNTMLGLEGLDLDEATRAERVERALDLVGLGDYGHVCSQEALDIGEGYAADSVV